MSETYCVYKHTCPNGKAYIGITKNVESRWRGGCGYDTQLFGKAVHKYGWNNIKHEILEDGLTKEQAESKEIELIDKYKLTDKRYGYNIHKGGQLGTSGVEYSPETRKKMSENTKRLWQNEDFRNHLLKHLAELNKNPRPITDEMRKKSHESSSKKVDQDDLDGNYIRTFKSLSEAARSIGKETNAAIVSCCKGKRKTYYGYIWKYHEEPLSESEIEYRKTRKSIAVPIMMLSQDGEILQRFDGIHDAGRILGINYKAIFSALKTGRNCNGFKWKYCE